jgi:hypothetical protein
VVSNDAAIVELGSVLNTNRSHDYKKGDIIPVRRERDDFGGDAWRAVSERELQQAEVVERFEAAERAKAEAAAKRPLKDDEPYLQEGEVGDDRELARVVSAPERKS